MELNQEYWKTRYDEGETGWNIGYASTPIVDYVDQLTDKSIRILIPGCGNAYEGEYLVKNGFTNTFLIDLVEEVLQNAQKRFPKIPEDHFICGDFFQHRGQYDLILEQTFFCAIDPNLRKDYVEQVYNLLRSGGRLVGVLFNRSFEKAGPPFGGSEKEYSDLFSEKFRIRKLEPCINSIKPRAGSELFINFQKP